MRKILTLMVGPPGSGKSTFAHTLGLRAADNHAHIVRINQDDQGKVGHMNAFLDAVTQGKDIIVDRMNFNKEQRARYITLAKAAGYEVEVYMFYYSTTTCMQHMRNRINHPTIKTEEDMWKALRFFFSKFEYPSKEEGIDRIQEFRENYNKYRPFAVICDLDGTLADIDHRLHFVRREGKKDWRSFFEGIYNDKLKTDIAAVLHSMSNNDYPIVYCSGRPDDYRESTQHWIDANALPPGFLLMRTKGDFRPDSLVKEIILDFEILTRYRVLVSIDDRKQVVEMWRKRGITCMQVAEGDF